MILTEAPVFHELVAGRIHPAPDIPVEAVAEVVADAEEINL